jgi:hypothetical protein
MESFVIIGGQPNSTTFGIPNTAAVVDTTFNAVRVALKPTEFLNQQFQGGHYELAAKSGLVTGAAATSPLFSFRWALSNGFALIKRVQIGWTLTTAFTTAQEVDFDIIRATAFTASDTGGTTLTPLGAQSNRERTSIMNGSQLTSASMATTGALTPGTRTLDGAPLNYATMGQQSAANTALQTGIPMTDMLSEVEMASHPLMLGNNEGFLVRNVTAMGAAGVLNLYVRVKWAEVPGL